MLPGVLTTLLKSKAQIGANRPTALITVGGSEIANVISVSIDRSKRSASQATIVVDNKGGAQAPDTTHILWPGKEVTIRLGYGSTQVLLFTGYVDTVTAQNPPAQITCACRDRSKLALDAMVQMDNADGVRVYGKTYLAQTLEYIFRDLAVMAGYPAGDITANATGITVDEITFQRESYADAFQKLCELCRFEWYCDEAGKLIFQTSVETAGAAAYTFSEGEDLIDISYQISDAEIYTRIFVVGKDKDGLPISATALLDESQYSLPEQKTLYIDAGDLISTTENCAALAAQEAASVAAKARNVTARTVGNPWLQIGDSISIVETTTTISEVYRVTEISHVMDAGASPIFSTTIQCYHYAAS